MMKGGLTLRTKDSIVHEVTDAYLASANLAQPVEDIANALLQQTRDIMELENAVVAKADRMKLPTQLENYQIARLIAAREPIKCVACAGVNADSDYDLLSIYQTSGKDEGIYVNDDMTLNSLIRSYNVLISSYNIQEVKNILRDLVPHVSRCTDPDLIAVNNGVFNYATKMLQPFDPNLIFLAKSRVNYIAAPVNPVIHNADDGTDWDVESWMNELSDDAEVVNLLWEILGAIIRPFVHWNKSAWFYSNTGNNGKGTLCELMRNLCGTGSYASISLSDFSKDFLLEPLTRASAIIVDENDVGLFIDRAANLKAVVTNDVIQINRKFKTPIAYQFFGFMVQCLNEYPRIKDKSDSFYRRQLFVPFTKCFTGQERKYIKADYLKRPDVLEYVLHKVLHMDYYDLSEPEACKVALEDYKEANDPVRQFADEILQRCVWDMLPCNFLYDLYKAWMERNMPKGGIQGKQSFIQDISVIAASLGWQYKDKSQLIRPGNKMSQPEPLILEYDLKAWYNPGYSGTDPAKRCVPMLASSYRRVLLRVIPGSPDVDNDDTPIQDLPFTDSDPKGDDAV